MEQHPYGDGVRRAARQRAERDGDQDPDQLVVHIHS
jgi:hypothetical protein